MSVAPTLVTGPTYEEMLHPHMLDPNLRAKALSAKRGDSLDPLNLFNITWRDGDGRCYHEVLPKELTGVEANIVVLCGCELPTGSHKVGAAYSVLLEELLTGEVSPGVHTCVWPSTGNYGIGGAWVGSRMGFDNLVVMPEGMSAERFEMIRQYGGRVITTTGHERNVEAISRRCAELTGQSRESFRVLNQFEDMGNYRFHYYQTNNHTKNNKVNH